jgi:hypothetical protein
MADISGNISGSQVRCVAAVVTCLVDYSSKSVNFILDLHCLDVQFVLLEGTELVLTQFYWLTFH